MITVNGCVGILSLLIRFYLSRANATRAQEQLDPAYDDVYIVVKNEKGEDEKRKVDKEFLDLTDGQNHEFRYVLWGEVVRGITYVWYNVFIPGFH